MAGKYQSVLLSLVVMVWMGLIFWFSAQPADQSKDMSEMVGYRVASVFVRDFDTWTDQQKLSLVERIDHPVRKCAHATEYAILTGLVLALLASHGIRGKRAVLAALAWTVLYACTDECHQLFVEGRAGMVTDVLIDGCGGAAMCLLWMLAYALLSAVESRAAGRQHG